MLGFYIVIFELPQQELVEFCGMRYVTHDMPTTSMMVGDGDITTKIKWFLLCVSIIGRQTDVDVRKATTAWADQLQITSKRANDQLESFKRIINAKTTALESANSNLETKLTSISKRGPFSPL